MNNLATTAQNNSLQLFNMSSLIVRYTAYLDTTAKTIETYSRALKQLNTYLLDNSIQNPMREDIIAFREYLKETGHKPTTIQNYITAIRIFFQWTALEGLYPNIAEHLKGAKLDREHKKDNLNATQAREVLAAIDRSTVQGKRDFAIVSLMITCGLRDIEIQRANIEDLRTVGDFTALYVQGKGREEKTQFVKVSPIVEKAIREYLKERGAYKESDPLFTSLSNNSKSSRLSTRSISGLVKESLKRAGYNSSRYTAHSLRHTAITLSLIGGEELTEVKEFARHSNINTTMIYNHAIDRSNNTCSQTVSNMVFKDFE